MQTSDGETRGTGVKVLHKVSYLRRIEMDSKKKKIGSNITPARRINMNHPEK